MNVTALLQRILFQNPVLGYNVWSLRRYIQRVARLVPAGASIVDVGAGECQYKPYFSHARYVSTDWCGTTDHHAYSAGIDYICSADDMPFEDASYDFVLSNQMLEHVRYPERVIAEMSRILKPGGLLFLTAPQTWEEHEVPHDYHRFTQYAMKAYAAEYGFEVLEIKPQGGRFIVIGHFLAWSIPTLFKHHLGSPYGTALGALVFYPVNFSIGLLFLLLDFLDRRKEFTLNYECIFRKKA
ncbi:class I SAM-dependent methyltransferase [Spirosoma panaciterrae]|uniref:class I SAM-dependent methyltransferase n=1 Tax=Spirosoma panaciterrae TaxID=496058 RepID=UPI000370924F|nr:class I SAM-dependent methyltransferase [Spirosoma panaciterrae]